jgi:hypothetical protein
VWARFSKKSNPYFPGEDLSGEDLSAFPKKKVLEKLTLRRRFIRFSEKILG